MRETSRVRAHYLAEHSTNDESSIGAQPCVLGAVFAAIAGAITMAYVAVPTGGLHVALPFVGAVGGAALPTSRTRPLAGRAAMALVAFAVLHVSDPMRSASGFGVARRLHSSDDAVRIHEINRNLDRGSLEFAGVDAHGVSFAGRDIARANFAKASAVGVDFSNANLNEANFEGTDLSEAKLDGARLSLVNLSAARGVGRATCDGATEMPSRWLCVEGHPALDDVGMALTKPVAKASAADLALAPRPTELAE